MNNPQTNTTDWATEPTLRKTDDEFIPDSTVENNQLEPRSVFSNLKFALAGIMFGIFLVKSEVISWFRIQEMFKLQSFHMYGVIGSAVLVGIISIWLIKKFKLRSFEGEVIKLEPKTFNKGQIFGGLTFGLGWAITGACPGPLFAQVGTGATVITVTLLSAIAGTWIYGRLRDKLPH